MSSNFYSIRKGVSLHPQASVAGTPSDGDIYYDSTVGKFQFRQASAWKSLGSGASGSGKNFFSDFDAELIAKVTTYNDSAAIPVDLTGGTVTGLTTALETTTPLTGTKSYKFSKDAANRQGQGFAILTDETLDYTVKQGESVTVKFKYKTSVNYVSGDVKMYVYRVGSNTLEALNGVDGLGAFGNSLNADQTGRGEFTATVSCSSSDTAIRVGFHVASTSALAYDLTVDNVFVGTSTQLVANVIGAKEPFIPTGSLTTNVTYTGFRKQIGDEMEYEVKIAFSGANTQGAVYINLPSGDVVDTTKITEAAIQNIFTSEVTILDSGTDYYQGAVGYRDTTSVNLFVSRDDQGTGTAYIDWANINTNTNVPFTFASGDFIIARFKVPLVRLNTGNTISSTQANFQSPVTRGIRLTSNQTLTANTDNTIVFNTAYNDQFATLNTSTGIVTFNTIGNYRASYILAAACGATAATGARTYMIFSGDSERYGADYAHVATLTANNVMTFKGTDIIKVTSIGQTLKVNFYPSTQNMALQVDFGQAVFSIEKIPDMTVVGVSGAPYERISALITTVTATTAADTRTDVTGGSIVVPPGKWKIGYKVATRIQRIGSLGDSYGRVNIESPAGAVMEQTVSFVGNSNMASSESVYDTVSAYQIVDVTTTGTYKLQITSYHAAASGVMHVIANTYGFFSGADADSEIYAERIK